MVAELLRQRASKVRQAVDVVYVLHVGPVEQVEELDAGFSLDPLSEGNDTLYPQIGVIVPITLVVVAGSVAHAVGERETVTVGAIKFGVKIVLRSIGQVDRGRNVDGFGPGVVGQEVEVVRKSLSHAESTGVVERETDRFHVEHEAEPGIGGPARRRYSRGGRGGTSSGRSCVAKIFLATGQSGAICFHVSRTVAVDASVHRQPAGMHPLISQRYVEVFANLVLHFEAGLLGEGLVEFLLSIAQRDLRQEIGGRIGPGGNKIHEIRPQQPRDRSLAPRPRRPEPDQVLAGILELRQERLIHINEFRSAHPAHQHVAVYERSVEQTEAAAHHTLPSMESIGKRSTWLDVVVVSRVEPAYLFQFGAGWEIVYIIADTDSTAQVGPGFPLVSDVARPQHVPIRN